MAADEPARLFFDVTRSNGMNVGLNPVQTVKPGGSTKYQWYAGDVTSNGTNTGVFTPIEFGATGLMSSDPIKHSNKGAFGSLIIEPAGQDVRIRLLQPGGHSRNNVFMVHGHVWEEEPYTNNSTVLGSNPFSKWKGAQYGVGPGSHFDFLLKHGAGGAFAVPGDYLYRTFQSFQFDGGIWGIFRVAPAYQPQPYPCSCPPGEMCTNVMCAEPVAYY